MIDKIIELFAKVNYPYYRQGSFIEGEDLPTSFYTFWNKDTPEGSFYDNSGHKIDWTYDISFYTHDASLIYSGINDVIEAAKSSGFLVVGKGKDLPTSEPTLYCRMVTVKYIQYT